MSKMANIIFASRLTEPIMAALTTEVTYVKSEMMSYVLRQKRNKHVVNYILHGSG